MTSNYENILEKDYQKLMEKYDIKSEKYNLLGTGGLYSLPLGT